MLLFKNDFIKKTEKNRKAYFPSWFKTGGYGLVLPGFGGPEKITH